jgi:hypothetical protein
MWFKNLTGFKEESPEQVRNNLEVRGITMTSLVNGQSMICGQLETPTLAELRSQTLESITTSGKLRLCEVISDAKTLHLKAGNSGALFQVASQFNLLEMPGPSVIPEEGVDGYEHDFTQGPACAVAAGAGTIYRNYFADVNGQTGQSSGNQIDCLKGVADILGNHDEQFWKMQNGYALPNEAGLTEISRRISSMTEDERDKLRQALRIGIHWDTQVTLGGCEHLVTQAYCSALPIGYLSLPKQLWKGFALLVLEASYEATLCAGLLNMARTGNNSVFLTLVGGGVFGNEADWIVAAIRRAAELFANTALDVSVVSFGHSSSVVRKLIASV